MKAQLPFVLILALSAAATAHAQAPAAPQVSVGADIKVLRFDWEPVPGASFYRLWVRPGSTASYEVASEPIPASITHAEIAIPLHLQDWIGTRYVVRACNASGCRSSAALNPRPLMLEAIGFLKASNTEPEDAFGQGVALSADGFTLAVTAWLEDSVATGVNGNQTNNFSTDSGAVYVFRRRGNAWHQEAYLKAGTNQPSQYFGTGFYADSHGTALSADGSILAVAAPREFVDDIEAAGVVYVFRRRQNVWSQMATLHPPDRDLMTLFGSMLDMSHDGRTIKVTSLRRRDIGADSNLRTHVFVRPADSWQHAVTLAPSHQSELCESARMSADGQTLVWTCDALAPNGGRICTHKLVAGAWVHAGDTFVPFHNMRQPIALNADASAMALREFVAPQVVGVYLWTGATWAREASLNGPGWGSGPVIPRNWGHDLAFNTAGDLLAIGDPSAREANAGIAPNFMLGPAELGAVYLFQRQSGIGTWALRNVVKSPRPGFRDEFGLSVALSGSGRTLAVGAPGENSNATGIDGVRANEEAPNAGAAYLY